MDTAPDTKTLLLLRHAKSSWPDGMADHDRPLSGRGRRDAFEAGRLLAERGVVCDVVACSTATRTRETWDRASAGGARAHEVRYLDQIYAARVTELVRVVRAMPESAAVVMLVGHGPAIPELVDLLAVRTAGSPDWERLDRKFPTAGLATLTIRGSWAHAGQARAQLESFEVPRGGVPT